MNTKKKYFLFPKPHLNHLLFLCSFIFSVIKEYFLEYFKKDDNISIPVFKLYIYDLGDLLSFIPYIIQRKKIKSRINNNNIKKEGKEINYIYNNKNKKEFIKNIKSIILIIFIISFIDFLAQISPVIYYLIKESQNLEVKRSNLNSKLIFNIIFLFLFSRLILKTSFYRHHYFSFIIFIICLIILIILDFIEIKNENENLIYAIIYLIVRIFDVLLFSIADVLYKVMFFKYYFSPYSLLLIKAIIQSFYLIIFTIPFFFIKFKDENGQEILLFSLFKNIFKDKLKILLYIIFCINSLFYNIFNLLLIDNFSANHSAISRIFENMGIFIIVLISKGIANYYTFAITIIIYLILIIASFIFNEFLVINICNLAKDTKLFLDYKEKRDLSIIEKISDVDDITVKATIDDKKFEIIE